MRKRRQTLAVGKAVSVADAIMLVKTDPSFPRSQRAGVLSSLNRLHIWANEIGFRFEKLTAATMPFNERTVTELFDKAIPVLVRPTRNVMAWRAKGCAWN
jgi:hypothetical protein